MSLMDRILSGAANVMIFGIVVLVICAAVLVTWWDATEGSGQHEDAQR